MARWFQSRCGIIASVLVVVSFACMSWDGFYYAICKRWFPPAPVIDMDSSFRWYLAGQVVLFCAILVGVIPRLRLK